MRPPRLLLALIAFEAAFAPLAALSVRSSFFLWGNAPEAKLQTGAYALAAILLLAAYGMIVWSSIRGETLSRRAWIIGFFTLLVLCLAIPPFFSVDTAGYSIIGRGLLAGRNPYLRTLSELQPAWAAALGGLRWLRFPSIYGPSFALLAALVMLVPVHGLLAAALVWKLAAAGAFVLSVVCLRKIVILQRLPAWIVPAYAFNPAVLFQGVIEGHNDVFMLACLLGAAYLYLKRAHLRGAALTGAAVAMKFFPVILLPMYLLDGERWRTKLGRIACAAGVFLASAAPFGFPLAAIATNLALQLRLPCFHFCSPIVDAADLSIGAQASIVRTAAALGLYAVIAYRFHAATKRGKDPSAPIAYIFWTLSVFMFVQVRSLTPWYPILLVPFGLLLSRKRLYLALTFAATAYTFLQFS